MYINVKTVWGIALQMARLLRRDHDVAQFSTINQKLGFQSGVSISAGEEPDVQYLAIGRGGLKNVGTDDRNYLQHTITDACLFEHIPWRVVPITADLDPAERELYRGRTYGEPQGVPSFIYWLRKVDISSSTPETLVVEQGQADVPFVPAASQQTPTPVSQDPNTGLPITTSNKAVVVRAPIEVTLTTQDITYIQEACEKIYGVAGKAVVTELAYCSGVDRTVTVNDGGQSVTYKEAIGVQPYSFVGDNVDLNFTAGSYTFRYYLQGTLHYLT